MPTESKSYRLPAGIVLAIGIAILAWALTFRGCSKAEDSPDEIPVYRTAAEANRAMDEAAKLSIQPLLDFQKGDPLGEPQKADLARAERLLKGVVAFEPGYFTAFTAVGRIEFVLGDYAEAERYLREAVRLAPEELKDEWVVIAAETHYWLSRTLYASKLYANALDEAEIAMKLAPDNVENLFARAQALIQVDKPDLARKDVAKALELDPEHVPSQRLKKLLDLAEG
ncbi:MAG: tetratricopeptide repeat protein [Fimbriimonadaceae bacterium]|nr:tetratricopeptide repeat protein [Fimbriimonadaceae bacterium]